MTARLALPARLSRFRFARRPGWPRRLLALALAALATVSAVRGGHGAAGPAPPPARLVAVLAASHDLPAGVPLRAADVRPLRLPAGAVPAHAFTPRADLTGRRTAGPVRRGEPLTDVRLLGAGLAATAGPGRVAVPVRLADAGAAALLRAGDHVDVLAAGGSAAGPDGGAYGPREADVVAADVTVLATPGTSGGDPDAGALVVLAAPAEAARRLGGTDGEQRITVALRPP